jgi:two-component system CheB/CheR fusion protein
MQPSLTAPRRVLVVEDNLDSAMSLVMLISDMGHHVEYALNGDAGLAMARKMRPEYVLLDIGLPGIDGYQVARQLRSEFGDAIRLIAVTGYGMEEDRRKAEEAGFDVHLLKPASSGFLESLLGARPAV